VSPTFTLKTISVLCSKRLAKLLLLGIAGKVSVAFTTKGKKAKKSSIT
jgi:hypothetical protein